MSEKPRPTIHRRDFIKQSAATGVAVSLSAASYERVYGANERIGVAFLGAGGRCQAHIDIIKRMEEEKQGVSPVGVCDVWDGAEGPYTIERGGQVYRRYYRQGLYPSAKRLGLNPNDRARVTKDYRRLLELKDADAVCVATPDHWHARMAIDAMQAGKDVYCEKPMTRTIEEAQALVDAWDKTGRVMTVGVQSMADPGWAAANELIRRGRIGHVAQAQTGVYRNDIRGQWRFYPLRREMTPQTIDWDMWLGHAFAVAGRPVGPDAAFDRALFAQWRCYGDFGGGIFTDLLAAPVTRLLAALGVRYPARVTGSGGLYLEHDGRDVPDVASLLAEFGEGFQLVATASTVTAYPVEEVIRGRFGALKFVRGGVQVIRDDPCRGSGIPARLEESLPAAETVPVTPPRNETRALWEDFLARVRSRDRNTLCPPDLAAAALATVAMGALGCRTGKVLAWDRARRAAVEAGENPAGRREGNARPPDAGPPRPPEYMRLAGPWVNGNDPARA